jgi:hypothetical protein
VWQHPHAFVTARVALEIGEVLEDRRFSAEPVTKTCLMLSVLTTGRQAVAQDTRFRRARGTWLKWRGL